MLNCKISCHCFVVCLITTPEKKKKKQPSHVRQTAQTAPLTSLPPMQTLLFFKLRHLTPSFAPVIITTATRGHRLAINITIDHSRLFSQITYVGSLASADLT